ncbi:glycoside hydrolase family 127 protein [Altererythrobacter indicus]|uniref:Glycoside hydrolase family 127 protein n=1 Tax=Altericroceibacterium indicum TaxID=374177 RepID=A0A845ACT6_9SPHN|nr:glycoside hydrolase family 127 protein [Altericroceibacterium indicum]MXP27053.1 glycoside hydrolase family 127 protein [Altericroceibacterium indicum]
MIAPTRRQLLAGAATVAVLAAAGPVFAADISTALPANAKPLPLDKVRLRPGPFAHAVETNRKYLLSLSADRLLHNYRTNAGLEPKGKVYGGWESDTIAGHTLGHYMSALALTHAQTGCSECRDRLVYIVDELETVQNAEGDGYVAGFTRKRKDGEVVDGKEIFPEIMAGDIRSGGFDLNGCWVPYYNWHKLFNGLFDAQTHCGIDKGLPIAVGLAGYIDTVFAALDDDQVETMLACEYGGLNESIAELYARTGNDRWLKLANRIYDHRVLDPLRAGEDKLPNFHANTQIPKLIGLARIYEVSGSPQDQFAARYFFDRVTHHHSYVIGGNADREYFFEPDQISRHITEQTCEHCNSYNMLKLTRHLYSWQPQAALFDYYERTHLNHILSQQHPETGGFTYMTPLMSGTVRDYSQPGEDAFWCCVGSGMESHAKHGESIFWQGEKDGRDMLLVNLYIPAEAHWAARGADMVLDTRYPYESESTLTLYGLKKPGRFPIAMRVPGFANGKAAVTVNGETFDAPVRDGYAMIDRDWAQGDTVTMAIPLDLRIESTPDDPDTIAILRGPLVLAADLGSSKDTFEGADPALVGSDLLGAFTAASPEWAVYDTQGIGRPGNLRFVPFYSQYDRRSAVYFKRFSESGWKTQEAAYLAEQARLRDIAARSVDVMHLGEMQAERDHNLESDISYPVTYRGRNGRDARSGGYFEFDMKSREGSLILQATYWGDERKRTFDIMVDGVKLATQTLEQDHPGEFFTVEYPVPAALTLGKSKLRIRFQPHDRNTAGPVFGAVLFTAKEGAPV